MLPRRRSLSRSRILALICALVPAGLAAQTTGATATAGPATRRAREVVALINGGTAPELRAYIDTAFASDLKAPAEIPRHLEFFYAQRDQGGGLRWIKTRENGRGAAFATVRRQRSEVDKDLVVAVDSAAPFRIVGFGIRPAPGDSSNPTPNISSDRALAREIGRYVDRLAAADLFSGTVLVAHEGRIVFQGAYGQQSKEYASLNRIGTRFNLGSMNKMITAIAIAQLVEAGRLSYEDPVSKFLPAIPTPRDAARIRIKHLLTHSSGMGEVFHEEFENASRASFHSVDDMMRLVRRDSLPFEPGSQTRYSNAGFVVLGKIIEAVTGQDYFTYVREHVYARAGMLASDSYALDEVNTDLATSYEEHYDATGRKWFENATWWSPVRGNPSGGGYASAPDLLRFAMALQQGRLVSARSVELLTTAKPSERAPDYGYGFRVDPRAGIFGHGGGAPGVSANLDIFDQTGYVAIVLSNYGGDSREPIVDRIRALVMSRTAAH